MLWATAGQVCNRSHPQARVKKTHILDPTISVSVKKMEEGRTGGASDMLTTLFNALAPRFENLNHLASSITIFASLTMTHMLWATTAGQVSNLFHPWARVYKTHILDPTISVSVKKMEEGGTGRASDIIHFFMHLRPGFKN